MKQLTENYRTARLDPKTLAILEYAERITRDPATMIEIEIRTLLDRGLSEEAILHAAAIASYFNYINRISDGLGVKLEPALAHDEPASA